MCVKSDKLSFRNQLKQNKNIQSQESLKQLYTEALVFFVGSGSLHACNLS